MKIIRKIFIIVSLALLWSCEKINNTEILKFYGDNNDDIGYSVGRSANGYIIAGQYTSAEKSAETGLTSFVRKMAVIRTDLNGIQTHAEILGGKAAASGVKVIALDDGSAVAAGSRTDESGEEDIYLVRSAQGGEGYTEKIIRMAGNQSAVDILKTKQGFIVLGTTDVERNSDNYRGNAAGKKDVLLLSLNNNMDVVMSTPAGFTGNDTGVTLRQDADSSYIVVGTTDRSESTDQAGRNIFILRYNKTLGTTEIRIIGGPEDEVAADFEIVSDGYLIAGTVGPEGNRKGHVWKIGGNIYGEVYQHDISVPEIPGSFSVNAICKYRSSSFIMAGQSGNSSSGDMLIFATDAEGYYIPGKSKIAGGTGSQAAFDVITDGEDIIAVGKNGFENNSIMSLLKFRF